jgi:protein-L-isoaspartate(D-aspartate) O-methyltransferase
MPTGLTAEKLRGHMVDAIVRAQPTSARVAEAMLAVPRHAFLPGAPVERAYADEAVITKRSSGGAALSCASVPSLVAAMLDQLDVQPGQAVLEIGAGTGYNAALLAWLASPGGHVTSIDIDPGVTAAARHALDATGCQDVEIVTGDGQDGDPLDRSYDRIIVTVGAWDLPPAWWDQLAPGGRLVVPLRWRGQTRAIAFTREPDRLRSDWVELCGFVPMIGQDGERAACLDPGRHTEIGWDKGQSVDPAALAGVLDRATVFRWSGVTVGPEDAFDGIWLRLTATDRDLICRITTDPIPSGGEVRAPAIPSRSPALAAGESLACLALRRAGETQWELGAIGHGPCGADLATRICAQIAWWQNHRQALIVTAYPAGTDDSQLRDGYLLDKPCTRLVITYT